jgi:hypothetical protein
MNIQSAELPPVTVEVASSVVVVGVTVGVTSVDVTVVGSTVVEVVVTAVGKPKPGTGAAKATMAEATRTVMKRVGCMVSLVYLVYSFGSK